jgi:tetratricopeptide (TPR) repeat protein
MGDLQRAASLHEELLENLDRYPLRSRPAFMGIFNTLLRGWVVNSLTTLYLAANRPQKALALITKNLSEGEVEMRGRAHLLAGRSLDAMGRREEAQREYSASLELVNRAIAMLGGATLDTLNILPADPAEGMRRHARLRALYALWADPLDERYYWGYWRPGSLRAILDREKKAVLDARAGSSNVPARHSDQAGKGTGALTTVYLLGKPAT